MSSFPEGFVWGAASASYQIEGGATEDGKGPSIWDEFCTRPGAVWQGHSGDMACDHYHRWREDVALAESLRLRAYRFSVSWPRVLPEGTGEVNARGLDFYDRLVDALLGAGIAPYVTLFHWDSPLACHRRGGWLHADSPRWFADYARVVAARLGDRVPCWMTMNEPQVVVDAGLREGRHAPGEQRPFADVLLATHHVLLAHGLAVQAVRAEAPRARVGLAPVGLPAIPASDGAADVEAARRWTFRTAARTVRTNAWWMDPIFLGAYPAEGLALFGVDVPAIGPDDLLTIAQPLDFFGVNLYDAPVVRAGAAGPEALPIPVGAPITAFDWRVTPEAMHWGARFFHERYRLPILVTENGLSCRDWVSLDGAVHDPQRIDFIARHLRELHRALEAGVPVLGYFHWTLLDNFEWAHGYKHRFGLVHVDFATQERIVKDSGRWYARVIASSGKAALEGSGSGTVALSDYTPGPMGVEEDDREGDGDVVLERAPKVARARRYRVVFYNDDYTTKWFVVHVLERFFHMSEAAANQLMMAIHRQGKGVAGVYTRDIAETKAAAVMGYAREFEMPLMVTAEPDSDGEG